MLGFNYGDFSAVYRLRFWLSTGAYPAALNMNSLSDGKFIVLVGLMGAGKTSIGRMLAEHLGIPFIDADAEIEKAAGCPIEEIFRLYGEQAFRDGERRVIARILDGSSSVLATGGGAFMAEETRAVIREKGISVWLRADVEVLYQRTRRRSNRPLLENDDPLGTLQRLADVRYPVYAEADITVDTAREKPSETMGRILIELENWGVIQPAPAQAIEKA